MCLVPGTSVTVVGEGDGTTVRVIAEGKTNTGYLQVQDQKPSGTAAQAIVFNDITFTRTLNTVVSNSITGASLSSNVITLPAGTYDFRAKVSATATDANGIYHKGFLYNITDSTYTGTGESSYAFTDNNGGYAATPSLSEVSGRFTITATKTFSVRHLIKSSINTGTLGYPMGASGVNEVYTKAEFWKVS
jgi:hypothetical protein